MGQANRRQKLGLVWRNRKKISQIIKDYFYLLFLLLIILCSYVKGTYPTVSVTVESCRGGNRVSHQSAAHREEPSLVQVWFGPIRQYWMIYRGYTCLILIGKRDGPFYAAVPTLPPHTYIIVLRNRDDIFKLWMSPGIDSKWFQTSRYDKSIPTRFLDSEIVLKFQPSKQNLNSLNDVKTSKYSNVKIRADEGKKIVQDLLYLNSKWLNNEDPNNLEIRALPRKDTTNQFYKTIYQLSEFKEQVFLIVFFLETLIYIDLSSCCLFKTKNMSCCPACPASCVGKVELLMLSVSFQLKLEANPEIPERISWS